jgi:hypothetical protein
VMRPVMLADAAACALRIAGAVSSTSSTAANLGVIDMENTSQLKEQTEVCVTI